MKNGLEKLMERNIVIVECAKYQETNFINYSQEKKTRFLNYHEVLPKAIADYLNKQQNQNAHSNSALQEIEISSKKSKRSIINEITFENYSYYLGFDKLK